MYKRADGSINVCVSHWKKKQNNKIISYNVCGRVKTANFICCSILKEVANLV